MLIVWMEWLSARSPARLRRCRSVRAFEACIGLVPAAQRTLRRKERGHDGERHNDLGCGDRPDAGLIGQAWCDFVDDILMVAPVGLQVGGPKIVAAVSRCPDVSSFT